MRLKDVPRSCVLVCPQGGERGGGGWGLAPRTVVTVCSTMMQLSPPPPRFAYLHSTMLPGMHLPRYAIPTPANLMLMSMINHAQVLI